MSDDAGVANREGPDWGFSPLQHPGNMGQYPLLVFERQRLLLHQRRPSAEAT